MIVFLKRFWNKLNKDKVFLKASALSYTFVLSLIPLLSVVFSLYFRFEQFNKLEKDINALILKLFTPQYVAHIQMFIDTLLDKSTSMGILGIIGLVFFSVLLLETVDNTLHEIWCVRSHRPRYIKYISYWAFITLSPLFIALSLYLSSIVRQTNMGQEFLTNTVFRSFTKLVLPWLLTSSSFFILYYILPRFPFTVKNAIIVSALSGFLWEISKYLFDYYIDHFSLIPYIYGAISVLPMFLIWIYFSWLIALLGAELLYVIEGFEPCLNEDAAQLAIVITLFHHYTKEGAIEVDKLTEETGIKKPLIVHILNKLYDIGLITFIENGKKVITTVSPQKITILELLSKLGMLKFKEPDTEKLIKILKPITKIINNHQMNFKISEVLNYGSRSTNNSTQF